MISVYDNKKCCACNACADICPQKAIVMKQDPEGFAYPIVDEAKCNDCGLCEKVCPAISLPQLNPEPEVYALQLKDEEALKKSQSGGAFWAIAKPVLESGGVVYGAAFDDKMKVVYDRAETIQQAQKFHGSKYVQGDMAGILPQIRSDLKAGRQVLFTGTACHVAGVYKYLGRDYDNLLTIDLICHGVPSQKVLDGFFDFVNKKYNSKVCDFNFRYYDVDKNIGWNGDKSEKSVLENGKEVITNEYLRVFSSNWALRPYCYTCPYAKTTRVGDFSIGDFWGVENFSQTFNPARGVSVVLVNSPKAKQMLPLLSEASIIEKADMENVKKYQHNLKMPSNANKRRGKIMKRFIEKGFLSAYRLDRFYYMLYCLKQKVLKR
ncbi:MAG: Coenzyme F420 hydrogenase/dehydrogenase, beta subunit C-terminal domain [Clostridia bacterium]|nr:Coenzyme F420 hydrogenase/dehydrogenase, beta subunit C-terminal domain [Clostridia bacterium]